MPSPDKVEAVKKVTETLSKQSNPAEELERVAPNKEQFQTLMNPSQKTTPTSFERLDKRPLNEDIQKVENNPILTDESRSPQKSGTATDQENKRGRQQANNEGVEGVAKTRSTQPTSSSSSSLMNEVTKLNKNVAQLSQMNPEAIKAQTKDLFNQIEKVKTQLTQTQAEIKPSYQTLLRNKLSHIDDNLKIALSKAGVEYTPPPVAATQSANPIRRFVDSLTSTQSQLENFQQTVNELNIGGGKEISPANMLAIQIKMGHIQQEMELFTSLLNKALESTKTIMNVQV